MNIFLFFYRRDIPIEDITSRHISSEKSWRTQGRYCPKPTNLLSVPHLPVKKHAFGYVLKLPFALLSLAHRWMTFVRYSGHKTALWFLQKKVPVPPTSYRFQNICHQAHTACGPSQPAAKHDRKEFERAMLEGGDFAAFYAGNTDASLRAARIQWAIELIGKKRTNPAIRANCAKVLCGMTLCTPFTHTHSLLLCCSLGTGCVSYDARVRHSTWSLGGHLLQRRRARVHLVASAKRRARAVSHDSAVRAEDWTPARERRLCAHLSSQVARARRRRHHDPQPSLRQERRAVSGVAHEHAAPRERAAAAGRVLWRGFAPSRHSLDEYATLAVAWHRSRCCVTRRLTHIRSLHEHRDRLPVRGTREETRWLGRH